MWLVRHKRFCAYTPTGWSGHPPIHSTVLPSSLANSTYSILLLSWSSGSAYSRTFCTSEKLASYSKRYVQCVQMPVNTSQLFPWLEKKLLETACNDIFPSRYSRQNTYLKVCSDTLPGWLSQQFQFLSFISLTVHLRQESTFSQCISVCVSRITCNTYCKNWVVCLELNIKLTDIHRLTDDTGHKRASYILTSIQKARRVSDGALSTCMVDVLLWAQVFCGCECCERTC